MSEDEDDLHMDFSSDNSGVDFSGGHDMTGFGPLLPTESERSLMERVRQELKLELKQVSYVYLKTHNNSMFVLSILFIFVLLVKLELTVFFFFW